MERTEANNPRTQGLSSADTLAMLRMINEEDKTVAFAVERALPQLARVVDECVSRVKAGGRVFYAGCGTSGRLALVDASEIGCTYGVDGVVRAIVAGGKRGISDAALGDEDSVSGGKRAAARCGVSAGDVLVGLSASGGTPYVLGAISAAKKRGAFTAGIVNNPQSAIAAEADAAVELLTGAEAVEGSTRMKAGTAQKMALNMLSTALMARLGKVYRNYMINMRPYNEKLRGRAVRIVSACADCSEETAKSALLKSEWQIDAAILMARDGCDFGKAKKTLAQNGGVLV